MERVERTMGSDGIWRDRKGEVYYSNSKRDQYTVRYTASTNGRLTPSATVPEVESPLLESDVKVMDSDGQGESALEHIAGKVTSFQRRFIYKGREDWVTILFHLDNSSANYVIFGNMPFNEGFTVGGHVRPLVEGTEGPRGQETLISYQQVNDLRIFDASGNLIQEYGVPQEI